MRNGFSDITEEWQMELWPDWYPAVGEDLIGHDILQKLKKETNIGKQEQEQRKRIRKRSL